MRRATWTQPWGYDVFGAVRNLTGSQPNDFTFAGEQVDGSTGLQYLRARYYDMQTGRFLSIDPLTHGSQWHGHRYAYAEGNPVWFVDRAGLQATEVVQPQDRVFPTPMPLLPPTPEPGASATPPPGQGSPNAPCAPQQRPSPFAPVCPEFVEWDTNGNCRVEKIEGRDFCSKELSKGGLGLPENCGPTWWWTIGFTPWEPTDIGNFVGGLSDCLDWKC